MKTPEEIKKGMEYLSTRDPAKKFKLWQEGIAYDWQEDAAADALAYIQQLEAQVPRWIPVEERLPEDDEMYLVYTTENTCAVYRYWGDGEWETEWGEDASHDITHWMPLPEPPKEEEE